MSLPLELLIVTGILNLSRYWANISTLSYDDFTLSNPSIGLYYSMLTLTLTYEQISTNSYASTKLSLKSLKAIYSKVILFPSVFL